ncbi:unnamed protein product [Polarella glacialis]|uniref:EF-hand domain-containing protein n=1 Tax=Polarella glacialis TaxID=89957 RepID=A0A813HII5_POLGL|nr:unnamed protein product [Polarella glacialis]
MAQMAPPMDNVTISKHTMTCHPHNGGTLQQHLEADETLQTADVRESVKKPHGVDEATWIATQTRTIFEEVVRVVSFIEDICTEETCKTMCAGKCVVYSWAQEDNMKPVRLSAPQYMRQLIDWAHCKLNDEAIMPTNGGAMPKNLKDNLSQILRRLFRVYAHAYLHHFQPIHDCGAEAHVNCMFKHFLFFVLEFKLVGMEDMLPLAALIKKFKEAADVRRRSSISWRSSVDLSPQLPAVAFFALPYLFSIHSDPASQLSAVDCSCIAVSSDQSVGGEVAYVCRLRHAAPEDRLSARLSCGGGLNCVIIQISEWSKVRVVMPTATPILGPILSAEESVNHVRCLLLRKSVPAKGITRGSTGVIDPIAKWRNHFTHCSADGRASVSFEEMRQFVRKSLQVCARACSDEQLRLFFQVVDGEGRGRISFEQFLSFVQQKNAKGKQAADALIVAARSLQSALQRLRSAPT